MVLADLDVLGIALRNLLENAVRYGAADAPIEVYLDDARLCLGVRSGGELVPGNVLATLKQPFPARHHPGHGRRAGPGDRGEDHAAAGRAAGAGIAGRGSCGWI